MQHIDLKGKQILVTGCPGFIEANLVIRLLKELKSARKAVCEHHFHGV